MEQRQNTLEDSETSDICKAVLSDFLNIRINELNYPISELGNINIIASILNRRYIISSLPESTQLQNLNSAYNNGDLVLVLGAGVSTGCGLPSWEALLKKLQKNIHFNRRVVDNQKLIINKIFFKIFDKNPLILARNLHRCFSLEPEISNSVIFEKIVRCALYEGLELKYTKLLKEIIRLNSYNSTKAILDSIITYNWDDVVEHFLGKIGSEIRYKSIYHDSEISCNGELPIYHVHGFLPRTGDLTFKNRIILSEEAYHYLYNNYLWNNEIQLEKFKNKTCLLVGVSLKDPNLRRLLDIARKEKNNNAFHHIIMLRPKLNAIEKNLDNLLKSNDDLLTEKIKSGLEFGQTVNLLRELEEKFFEEDALSLGVQTLWAENKGDIGRLLAQIKLDSEQVD